MEEQKMKENKQLKLNNFCKLFDIPRSTALKWIHSVGFPAYNLCGHWYIDVDKYYVWREEHHRNNYKYA